ncbi:hypothetical protein OSB04_023200 [Centaurea solstitialis]|uniref:Uncharacterized protein n=1 Tax=Centaurea solstitialis TaxID=347529 RepID=A0AA38SJE6_9ASTR|nr:hypothetical protein OSB04_023200 [Centaurea solstitialis]
MTLCAADSARAIACRDGHAAATLKLAAIFAIFLTSVVGISAPVMLARLFHGKPLYDKAILVIKCFAAGVILSTSLVHVLPDAFDALANCHVSSHHPWKDFPFSGLITLIGVLTALLVDLTATSHVDGYSHGHGHGHGHGSHGSHKEVSNGYTRIGEDEEMKKATAVVTVVEIEAEEEERRRMAEEEVTKMKMKQRMVSQVLEIGIIFHSVIIGVTLGMSQNKCTIKPLVAALAFHQIFEGMGLGGGIWIHNHGLHVLHVCGNDADGDCIGDDLVLCNGYDDSSANALILEGLLGSLSSGILIYMGLVDLIALDFFHNKLMSSETWLKKSSFVALVLGSTSMSILALWA